MTVLIAFAFCVVQGNKVKLHYFLCILFKLIWVGTILYCFTIYYLPLCLCILWEERFPMVLVFLDISRNLSFKIISILQRLSIKITCVVSVLLVVTLILSFSDA